MNKASKKKLYSNKIKKKYLMVPDKQINNNNNTEY